jgi:HTH-type transcriptional regulator / antitoxin HigA
MTDQRFVPEWLVPPGEVLVEALAERGMSQADLARRIARPLKTISEIATGKAALTPETAIQLERALGISASLWTSLEARYREALARRNADAELQTFRPWALGFPLKALREVEALPAATGDAEIAGPLLAFFGVSSPEGWDRRWAQDATKYRIGAGTRSREGLTAWLRLGELAAQEIEVGPFDRRRLRHELRSIRGLSTEAIFAFALDETRGRLAAAGVVMVVVPDLEGAPVSGAARWIRKGTPLIQLSLRYLSDDQFWYSLFHECGHLLAHKKVDIVEDVVDGPQDGAGEEEADRFARDALIPPTEFSSFVLARDFGKPAVRAFAAQVGVAPGIVVGRLHRDRLVPWQALNDLRKFYPEPRWRLRRT